jgi:hypothetical protein
MIVMKKRIVMVILVLIGGILASAFVTAAAFASGSLPGSGWWTTSVIQNVDTSNAAISVVAYNPSTASTYNASASNVMPNWSFFLDPASYAGMPSGFSGSAVASADRSVVAVSTIQNLGIGSNGVTGGKAKALVQGVNSPQRTLYYPVVKNNFFSGSTIFYIQNASAVTTTATITFTMYNGSTYTGVSASIPPNKMITIHPSDVGVPSTGNATQANFGFGRISATNASAVLASVWTEYVEGVVPAAVVRGTSGFTDSDVGTKGYVGIVKNNYFNERSSIQVLSRAAVPITVTLTYYGAASEGGSAVNCAGQVYTDTVVVAANSSASQQQFGVSTNLPDGCYGSAVLQGTGNFLALGNEGAAAGNIASNAKAAMFGNATTKLAAPSFFNDRVLTINSASRTVVNGFQVQNVSASTANVVFNFYCINASNSTTFTATTESSAVLPGAGILIRRPSTAPQAQYFDGAGGVPFPSSNSYCSSVVTSSQAIVGWMSESELNGNTDKAMYEAFNLP